MIVSRSFFASLGLAAVAAGAPTLTLSSAGGTLNGNYTTTKLFLDEVRGETRLVAVTFQPDEANVTEVEIITNLNQRHRATADQDGNAVEDGMQFNQTEGILGSTEAFYYRRWPATLQGGSYGTALTASRTGSYRLTARWKVAGDPNWRWFTNPAANRRDHAVVVSPSTVRDEIIYELNTLSVEAQAANATSNANFGIFIDRSTFEDLHDAPGAPRTADGSGFHLDYLTNLGVTMLWFQPIHPHGQDGRETDPLTGQPYNPGSPYAVKNFFEVDPYLGAGLTRASALTAFTNFVAAADGRALGVMLDAPFNHTAFDCELGAPGVALFAPAASPLDQIRSREARFYSRAHDYCQRAFSAGSIAAAPDRGDFPKWSDVLDVYFGRYDALVCQNPADNGARLNEGDRFYYDDPNFDVITHGVWKYFAAYALHWLDRSGYPAGTPLNEATRHLGIDGLRCDFGQGLPPQAWEYLINVARTRKWNFLFMAESLDGGAVTYRSNRHFDILNEDILFAARTASDVPAWRTLFDQRRNAYGPSPVLLNNTSHDEEQFTDPFVALSKYAVLATNDGLPMIFMGQELGQSRTFGWTYYESNNLGKTIPHFKKFNSLTPLRLPANRTFALNQIDDVYAAINRARQASPALRSPNRYFLNALGGGTPDELWAVAKYETAGASPARSDVVIAAANLNRNAAPSATFDLNTTTAGGSNLFGLKPSRRYNLRNLAAFTALDGTRDEVWQWPEGAAGRLGSTILSQGVFVGLNAVPATDGGWSSAPYEAQYLKVYDVTPPPAPTFTSPSWALAPAAVVTWAEPSLGPDDALSGYRLNASFTSALGANVNGTAGQTLALSLNAVSTAGIDSAATTLNLRFYAPTGDDDGDGAGNAAEVLAGTDPGNPADWLRLTVVNPNLLSANTVPGKRYQLETSTALAGWAAAGEVITATSGQVEFPLTASGEPRRFWRLRVVP
jgi:hypothetical protein